MTDKTITRQVMAVAVTLAWALPAAAQAPVYQANHPRILLHGAELARLQAELNAGTAAAVRFRNMVNSAVGGANPYDYKPWYSAMMGVLTGTASYCTDAVNRTETFVASEEALIAAGQRASVSYDVYLEVGDLVGNVAKVYDWCYMSLTPSQRTRWMDYASRAVANVWDPPNARWGTVAHPWNGWSIDNPVNNYYYSFLRATMLYGLAVKNERAEADTWLNHFRTVKLGNQLVPVFNQQLTGGGSREGTGYGTAQKGLFNLYYLWEASTGERVADLTPHAADTMPYMMHALVPTRDRLAPIGDHARDSEATFYDYHREMLLALATIYRGTPMARRVRAELPQTNVPVMQDGFNIVYDFLYGTADPGPAVELTTAYRGVGTGHLFTRSSWAANATWLAFMTGAYSESHAHPDGLSILLYKNGWLVDDANRYSHSGIVNAQAAHGLVTQQVNGTEMRMYERQASSAVLTAMSSRPLYFYAAANAGTLFHHPSNGDPGVRSAREVVHVLPDVVVVFDRVSYQPSGQPGTSTKTFQLPVPNPPVIEGRTARMNNGGSTMVLHALQPAAATLTSLAMPSIDADYQRGHRIDVSITGSGETRFLNVLSLDGAAVTATQPAADQVVLALNDGREVTLAFNAGAPGGQITIRAPGGAVLVDEPLAGTIQTLAVTPPTGQPPSLVMATSRRSHGSAGTHDLFVDHATPALGNVTVEPRSGDHRVVLRFSDTLPANGLSATWQRAGEPAEAATLVVNGTEAEIQFPGAVQGARVTVTLNGLASPVAVSLGLMEGDVTGTRAVLAADIAALRARAGGNLGTRAVTPRNFPFDIDLSGVIDLADRQQAKTRSAQRMN